MRRKIFLMTFVIFFLFSFQSIFAQVDTSKLNITSGAALLIEPSTNKIIYEKNSKEKMYPASTTKIMTALLTLENCKLTDIVTVSQEAVSSITPAYATVFINPGEELTVEQLLNVLLIPSGNVAGNILAEHISGSIENFANLMNKRAQELGCTNTHFTNPYGLHDDNHYTCAYDLYLISKEAMKYDVFREIVKKTEYYLPPTNNYTKEDRNYRTTNDLIKPNNSKSSNNYYYEYAIGIKTGYTSQAKNCLVSAANKDGLELYCIILGAGTNSQGLDQRYLETKKLYDFAYDNYFLRTLREENSVFRQIEIKNATNKTKNLDVLVKDNITALVDSDNLYSTIPPTTTFKENLEAPIQKGEVIGSIKYVIDGITYESDLIAANDVEKSYLIYFLIALGIIIFILLILFIRTKINRKKVKYRNYRL